MDNIQKTPSAEALRQMPYSELKKIAKQHGIKGNLKAEKIIAALSSTDSDDTDSFSTPAAKEMNSSRKKKAEQFDEDNRTPLVTPRRGTYSLEESFIGLKMNKTTPLVTNESSVLEMANVMSSVANESSTLELSNVASSIVNESSVLDMSNVTIGRGSERKPRNRKVSFLSPVMTPHTPKNSNLKLRPKTPIGSRTPLIAEVSPFPLKELKINLERVDTSLHMTPLAEKVTNEPEITSVSFMENSEELTKKKPVDISKSTSLLISNEVSVTKKQAVTPTSVSLMEKSEELTKKKPVDISKSTSLLISNEVSAKKKQAVTPRLTRSYLNKNDLSKKKRLATPNFKKIHEKAFEKMESIDDYQKRIVNSAKKMGVPDFATNKVTKAKSKIPAFGGIPFIPSVSKSTTAKWDASTLTRKQKMEEKRKLRKDVENVGTRSKTKFDLKASLLRKLGYKPYTGALKPLTPSTLLNASSVMCAHKNRETPAKEPVNKVVSSKRMQSRSLLKGVRTNKRFELQMKNRKLE